MKNYYLEQVKKDKGLILILIACICIFSFADLLYFLSVVSGKTLTTIYSVVIVFFVYAAVNLLSLKSPKDRYFGQIFPIFILYSFVTVARGFTFSYQDLKSYLQSPYVFWPFVIPLFCYFKPSITLLACLFRRLYNLAILFLISCLFFTELIISRGPAQIIIPTLVFGSGLLLLNSSYLLGRKVNIVFVAILIGTLAFIYLARRNAVVTLSGFVIGAYVFHRYNKANVKLFRFFPLIIALLLFFTISVQSFSERLTGRLSERIYEDSRTDLYDLFYLGMMDDIFFGKGMGGKYYAPTGGSEVEGVYFEQVDYRDVIETGYLQLILNGGVLYLILYLLVLVPAIVRALTKSNNYLVKSCGISLILWLIDMFIFGLPQLNIQYILIWICVGICYDPTLREKDNTYVSNIFKIEF